MPRNNQNEERVIALDNMPNNQGPFEDFDDLEDIELAMEEQERHFRELEAMGIAPIDAEIPPPPPQPAEPGIVWAEVAPPPGRLVEAIQEAQAPNPPPQNGVNIHDMIREAAQRIQMRGFGEPQPNRPRRNAHPVVREGNVVVPRGVAEIDNPPQEFRVRRIQTKKPMAKIESINKKAVYPEEGVLHISGQRFARKLTMSEDIYLRNYGYRELLKKYPDLEWKEKEKPVNAEEEVILTISELADHYAMEECKATVANFDIKTHNKEYQVAYKKHVKIIASFKRNKHG